MPESTDIPEWLPDWRNESTYRDLTEERREQAIWEFLRRNPRYQKAYAYYEGLIASLLFEGDPGKLNELYQRIKTWGGLIRDRYGFPDIGQIQDPSADEAPIQFRLHWDDQREHLSLGKGRSGFRIIKPQRVKDNYHDYYRGEFTCDGLALPVIFTLSGRIDPQIKEVRALLLDLQKRLRGASRARSVAARARPEHYRDYLRILDARQSRASFPEIGPVVFPYLGKAKGSGIDRVYKTLAAAERLRDGGYKGLIAAL